MAVQQEPLSVTMNDLTSPAIALHQLSLRYGPHHILKGINLIINQGKMVVLHGSNGVGKTTLLKVIATKLKPSSGNGRIFTFDLNKEGHKARSKIAYLSVLGGNYNVLSALENLQLANKLYNKSLSLKALEAYLGEVGLLVAKDKLVRTFSSGMKKRLAIAKLLLVDAPLWVLDEPYTALDEAGKVLIDKLLIQANREGKTVIMASHELERSTQLADAVLKLVKGHLYVNN